MDLLSVYKEVDALESEIIETRRDFHRYAESAWTEFRTTSKIVEFLTAQGMKVAYGRQVINPEYAWAWPGVEAAKKQQQRAIEQGASAELVENMQYYTGAVTVIETGRPGPVIALRFDIDCNDVEESKEDSHRPYKEGFCSVNANMTHACGHDGHSAVGMFTAALLNKHKDELCGTIKLLFQPAEEGDRGAVAMIKTGILDDVDVVLSSHIFNSPNGEYGLAGTQTCLYATTKFDINITGKSAHAGFAPQTGNNAINAACVAVAGMQSFLQDGRGSGRLNIGTISGGSGRNVIAESCHLRAETRGSTTEVEQRLYKAAIDIVDGVCKAFGCSYTTEIKGICPTGNGDLDLAEKIAKAAAKIPDFKYTQTELAQTGGTDDFSCMMDAVREHGGKACYMALMTPLKAGHHNRSFDYDEGALKAGVKAFITVVDMLQKEYK
ncbi:MAG: amidohydrolase [Oscillospiraceae bacterium]|nr:amidohydrolase [Oscillospiraceae bacterium]